MAVSLHQLLKTMTEMGGTDLHITTNSPPQIRIDGILKALNLPPMTPSETKQLAYSILTDNQKHRLEENLEIDLSFGIKGLARFRANIFHQRGAIAGAFRQIPYEIRSFRELGLPCAIRSDNGTPFASTTSTGGLTRLSVHWLKLGIRLERTDLGAPQQLAAGDAAAEHPPAGPGVQPLPRRLEHDHRP